MIRRFKQAAASGETIYLNGRSVLSERLIGSGGATQWTDYLFAGGGVVGMRVEHSVGGVYTRYFHKDHLRMSSVHGCSRHVSVGGRPPERACRSASSYT